jgi:hypothetical protein
MASGVIQNALCVQSIASGKRYLVAGGGGRTVGRVMPIDAEKAALLSSHEAL